MPRGVHWCYVARPRDVASRPANTANPAPLPAGTRKPRLAIAFDTVCSIAAAWLPLAIAVFVTVMRIYWVAYAMRAPSEPDSTRGDLPCAAARSH